METNYIDMFNSKLREYGSQAGVLGPDASDMSKNFKATEVTEENEKKSSKSYLKDGVTLSQIYDLAKNKKLSNNRIKSEIKKLLNDPEELYDFLNSFRRSDDTKKEESKEATGSGGGVGAFEGPLFSGEEPDIKKVETKEATSSSSSGSYESPSFLAKSMSKKNWRGRSKTQLPGGKFVQVKKKCKKFPYCNQGDIKALNIFENDTLKGVIQKVSERYDLHEDHIKDIILNEMSKLTK
jgi:hypothetical protein